MFYMHTKSQFLQNPPLSFDDLVFKLYIILVQNNWRYRSEANVKKTTCKELYTRAICLVIKKTVCNPEARFPTVTRSSRKSALPSYKRRRQVQNITVRLCISFYLRSHFLPLPFEFMAVGFRQTNHFEGT